MCADKHLVIQIVNVGARGLVDGEHATASFLYRSWAETLQVQMQKTTNFCHPTCTSDIYADNVVLPEDQLLSIGFPWRRIIN
jgi:hypothetical protein